LKDDRLPFLKRNERKTPFFLLAKRRIQVAENFGVLHEQEVAGSSPAPPTKFFRQFTAFFGYFPNLIDKV